MKQETKDWLLSAFYFGMSIIVSGAILLGIFWEIIHVLKKNHRYPASFQKMVNNNMFQRKKTAF